MIRSALIVALAATACGQPPECVTLEGLALGDSAGVGGWSCGELQTAVTAALVEFKTSSDPRLHDAARLNGYTVTVIAARTVAPGDVAETGCDGSIEVDAQPAGGTGLAHEIAHVLQGCRGRGEQSGAAHSDWGTPGVEDSGDVYPALSRLGDRWDRMQPQP